MTRLPVIFTCFENLPDPRRQSGNVRHNLIEVVFSALVAIVGGANHWTEIEGFVEAKLEWFRKFVRLEQGVPSHDTYGRIFAAMEPESFMECMKVWIESLQVNLKGLGVHIDGKTLRRSYQGVGGLPAIHMVSAWVNEAGLCLGQLQADGKSNEITAVPSLLEILDLEGAVVTLDAMNCQTKTVDKIRQKAADYVITVKSNQEKLHDEIAKNFLALGEANFPAKKCDSNHTTHFTRGRVEERQVVVTSVPESIRKTGRWKDIQTIGMVYRHRERDPNSKASKTVPETDCVTYFISSLSPNAALHAKYVREHWTVETQLHWSLDVNFTEDANRVREGNGPAIFSALRRFALSIIKQDTSMPKLSQRAKRLKAGWSNQALETIIFR